MRLVVVAGFALFAAGCAPAGSDSVGDDLAARDAEALTTAEAERVLAVANTATLDELDADVGLDRRAAEGIVRKRNGADGVLGTTDDAPFGTIAALDAVAWVGPSAFEALLDYADLQAVNDAPCVVISEYIEGAENDYKAIELYNCGTKPVDLSTIGVCLVRNADTTCTITRKLSAASLAPGAVWGVCRNKDIRSLGSGVPYITRECDDELPGVMGHNGDDRLLVFRDDDGDAKFARATDTALDAFGVIGQRPTAMWWADKVFRRCDLAPFDGFSGGAFYATDRYTQHARSAQEHYGTPPALGGCP